jgi:carbamoyl-phosphate synthase large subunit
MFKVLVTAVGGGGIGEQIVKALRISKKNYYIVGTDIKETSKGLYEVDKPIIIPVANDPAYIEILLNICLQEDIKVLFCGSEAEIKRISPERKRFIEQGILFPYNKQEILDLCFDKLETINWLKKNEFAYPQTFLLSISEDLNHITEFPVVLKPHLASGGSTNVFIAQDEKELLLFSSYLFAIYDSFIAQQYIGTPDDEYTVGVLSDMEGNLINSIAVRKNILTGLSNKIRVPNRTNKKELGDTLAISSGISQGEIGRFETITKQCEAIALKMNCVGAVNIQCRVVNDLVHVFEINPRFSGTTSLRAIVGYNEPDTLIQKYFSGAEPELHFAYKTGIIMRGITEMFIERGEVPTEK